MMRDEKLAYEPLWSQIVQANLLPLRHRRPHSFELPFTVWCSAASVTLKKSRVGTAGVRKPLSFVRDFLRMSRA